VGGFAEKGGDWKGEGGRKSRGAGYWIIGGEGWAWGDTSKFNQQGQPGGSAPRAPPGGGGAGAACAPTPRVPGNLQRSPHGSSPRRTITVGVGGRWRTRVAGGCLSAKNKLIPKRPAAARRNPAVNYRPPPRNRPWNRPPDITPMCWAVPLRPTKIGRTGTGQAKGCFSFRPDGPGKKKKNQVPVGGRLRTPVLGRGAGLETRNYPTKSVSPCRVARGGARAGTAMAVVPIGREYTGQCPGRPGTVDQGRDLTRGTKKKNTKHPFISRFARKKITAGGARQ